VADRLIAAGFRNARPLQGGYDAWIRAGLPVVPRGADPGGGYSTVTDQAPSAMTSNQ
jgi:hypothetical protein